MPRPRTRSDDEILAAALHVVGQVGPARLTLAAVAREAGLSAAALVQRFGSKRELLLALNRGNVGRLPELFARSRPRYRSPLRALVGTLCAMAEPVADPVAFSNHLAYLHMDLSDPDFHASALAHAQSLRGEIAALLEEALATGELRSGADPTALARTVESTYNGALITWAVHRETKLATWLRRELEAVLAPWVAASPDGA